MDVLPISLEQQFTPGSLRLAYKCYKKEQFIEGGISKDNNALG
jgi:hypothetical protein